MPCKQIPIAAAVALSAIALGTSAVAAHSGTEQTYTITSIMQILQPVNPADMTDDFQDCKVIAHDKDSYTLQITYFPLYQQPVDEDANWRSDDAAMTQYLQPTPTENWDPPMRDALLAQLHASGIDPDRLGDRQLVEQVSKWAMRRAHSTDAFAIWMCCFQDGKPAIFPPLMDAFGRHSPPGWTPQQTFDQELLGKSMFYGKVHGSCTSASIYLATILRALGIPTRIIFCIPPFDPNDPSQADAFYDAIHHNQIRETVHAALNGESGFDNHLFNEVFVGHHWIRLNYSTLGQPILDRHYFGLLTHIYTTSDLSQTPLAQTWGMRYFHYPADQPKLSSVNPYRLISVHDHFGRDSHEDNPPVAPAEYRTVTIDRLIPGDAPQLPEFFRSVAIKDKVDYFISYKERVDGAHPMRSFFKRAGHEFTLTAPNCPPIKIVWTGASVSEDDLQTVAARIDAEDRHKLVPGIAYTIEPNNVSDVYRWVVQPDVIITIPKR
jgi:transglutaminase-like putative cysteine protease